MKHDPKRVEPREDASPESPSWLRTIATVAITLYVFILSINLLGHSFKLFGRDFAVALLEATSDPFLSLFLGILATSVIQSSSTTTSITVGLVAAGALNLENAIPVIMGANIGTTVTNTLVSFGHATRRAEFRRAFSSAIVHDIFNMLAVIILFPIELLFRPIERVASILQDGFADIGGMQLFDPIKFVVNPAIELVDRAFSGLPYPAVLTLVLSLILMFGSLALIVRTMRSAIVHRAEAVIDRYIFSKDPMIFLTGIALTVLVQSSTITTSLLVPLAGAGLLGLRQIFPFTLGANIGTTVTAIIAALATGSAVAVTVAFSHLLFNIFGIAIIYPMRAIPIGLARLLGDFGGRSPRNVIFVIIGFILLYTIPLLVVVL